jgi:hypothetical protein
MMPHSLEIYLNQFHLRFCRSSEPGRIRRGSDDGAAQGHVRSERALEANGRRCRPCPRVPAGNHAFERTLASHLLLAALDHLPPQPKMLTAAGRWVLRTDPRLRTRRLWQTWRDICHTVRHRCQCTKARTARCSRAPRAFQLVVA